MANDDSDWVLDPLPVQQDKLLYPPAMEVAKGHLLTADDAVRAFANSVTAGFADRAAGAANRATGLTAASDYSAAVNEEVARSDAARERSPIASVAGDVAGSIALSRILPGFGSGTKAQLGSGALFGGLQGAGNVYTGNTEDYVKGGGLGAVFGLAGGAGQSLFKARPQVPAIPAPTGEQHKAIADRGYELLRQSPATYDARFLAQEADRLEQELYKTGHHPVYSPKTWAMLDWMRQGAGQQGGVITPGNIDTIRQGISKIPKTADKDLESGMIVRDALDKFLTNPPAGAVRPGTEAAAAQAAKIAEFARGSWAAYKRDKTLGNMEEAAQMGASGTHSGLNYGNLLRQDVKHLLNPKYPWRARGFSPEEKDALAAVNAGGPAVNAARYVGNYLGGGGGLAALAATGTALGSANVYGGGDPTLSSIGAVAAPAAGLALRLGTNRATANAFRAAQEQSSRRSPLYQSQVQAAGNPMVPSPKGVLTDEGRAAARNALALELLRQQQQQQQPE
jgi:hypothetical protein